METYKYIKADLEEDVKQKNEKIQQLKDRIKQLLIEIDQHERDKDELTKRCVFISFNSRQTFIF